MWNIWIRSLAIAARRRQLSVHLVRASSSKLQMYFFKNGTGWCVRHDPRTKPQAPSTKPHAPIFRKNSFGNRTRSLAESCLTSDGGTRSMAARDLVQASSSEEPSENLRSTKLREQQAASFKPQATSCKLQAASFKLHDS